MIKEIEITTDYENVFHIHNINILTTIMPPHHRQNLQEEQHQRHLPLLVWG